MAHVKKGNKIFGFRCPDIIRKELDKEVSKGKRKYADIIIDGICKELNIKHIHEEFKVKP